MSDTGNGSSRRLYEGPGNAAKRYSGIERALQGLIEREPPVSFEWEDLDPELARGHLEEVRRIAAGYREVAARIEAVAEGRTPSICAHCTERFLPLRSDARFCTSRCRVTAHRAKK